MWLKRKHFFSGKIYISMHIHNLDVNFQEGKPSCIFIYGYFKKVCYIYCIYNSLLTFLYLHKNIFFKQYYSYHKYWISSLITTVTTKIIKKKRKVHCEYS